MRSRVAINDVSRRLSDNIESVCTLLLPGGKRCGRFYEAGSIHGESGKTLKVNLEGEHRGRWVDWNGQEHKGDALDLWAATKGIPLPDALKQAKDWLGIREPVLPERTYRRPQDDCPQLDANGKAMQWLTTTRKLESRIVNRFRVQGDAKSRAIVFPCYSPTGELVNRSYRALELDDKGKKKVWQDKEAAPCLFGWHALDARAFESREVLICEGQIDAMTWTQWGIDALSIPNGSGGTWLEAEWHNLEAFRTIYLALDQDQAGQKNVAEITKRLGKHRCRIVRYPHKDANDALKAGVGAVEARQWVDSSEYANVPHLVTASYFERDTIEQFFPSQEIAGFNIPQTKHENPELTFRFRPGELTVWTGVTSHGKSTLLNYGMCVLAAKTKRPSLIVSLEMNPAKILRRLMLGMNMPITNAQDVKDALLTLEKWLLFCDKVGKITREELFELLQYAHARYGIAHCAIDSLMRVQGLEEDYPAQNEFITDLVTFSRDTGVHVHLVAHPRKSPGHNAPESQDIKGSGHIRDNADNVLVVWRNREKEKMLEADPKDRKAQTMPDARLIIEKDREEGMYRDFPLSFSPHDYVYSPWKKP